MRAAVVHRGGRHWRAARRSSLRLIAQQQIQQVIKPKHFLHDVVSYDQGNPSESTLS